MFSSCRKIPSFISTSFVIVPSFLLFFHLFCSLISRKVRLMLLEFSLFSAETETEQYALFGSFPIHFPVHHFRVFITSRNMSKTFYFVCSIFQEISVIHILSFPGYCAFPKNSVLLPVVAQFISSAFSVCFMFRHVRNFRHSCFIISGISGLYISGIHISTFPLAFRMIPSLHIRNFRHSHVMISV